MAAHGDDATINGTCCNVANPNPRGNSMKALIALTAMGLIVTIAQTEPRKTFALIGYGASTCAQFANLFKLDQGFEDIYFSWAEGYLSGWNDAQLKTTKSFRDLSSLSTNEQQAFLRSYCDQHPLSGYLEAVWTLRDRLNI